MPATLAVELYRANIAAQLKVKRNAHKLAWMDANRNQADNVIRLSADLDRYIAEAKKAAEVFAAYCEGMTAAEIVAIINKATKGE